MARSCWRLQDAWDPSPRRAGGQGLGAADGRAGSSMAPEQLGPDGEPSPGLLQPHSGAPADLAEQLRTLGLHITWGVDDIHTQIFQET